MSRNEDGTNGKEDRLPDKELLHSTAVEPWASRIYHLRHGPRKVVAGCQGGACDQEEESPVENSFDFLKPNSKTDEAGVGMSLGLLSRC